jgi:hypothetical protein
MRAARGAGVGLDGAGASLQDSQREGGGRRSRGGLASNVHLAMSPTWIWLQVAIIVFVVAGMIIAVTKLA